MTGTSFDTEFCEPAIAMTKSIRKLINWLWLRPNINLHTLTLDDWDAKHGCHRWLAMVAIPKRLLPCRAFVTDLCGVNVPWSYSENRPWTSEWDQIGTYLKVEIWVRWTWTAQTYTGLYILLRLVVCALFGDIWLGLIPWWIYIIYIYTYIYIPSRSIWFMQWRQLAVFSCMFFSLFSFFRRFHNDFIVSDIYVQGSWTSVLEDLEGIAKKPSNQ